MQKYLVNQYTVENIVGWVKSKEIAIPEIQRPFVWSRTKVRDLMDSLYQGYPVGYIISWRNPDVKLKDGSLSMGKKVLIDGQQRITALTAALVGEPVIDESYEKVKIQISFHPVKKKFEVLNPAIKNNREWIPDISVILKPDFSTLRFVKKYFEMNSKSNETEIETKVFKDLPRLETRKAIYPRAAALPTA